MFVLLVQMEMPFQLLLLRAVDPPSSHLFPNISLPLQKSFFLLTLLHFTAVSILEILKTQRRSLSDQTFSRFQSRIDNILFSNYAFTITLSFGKKSAQLYFTYPVAILKAVAFLLYSYIWVPTNLQIEKINSLEKCVRTFTNVAPPFITADIEKRL